MSDNEQQNDKVTPYTDDEKLSDEIIEQTMQEIFDDIAESEEFVRTEETNLKDKKTKSGKKSMEERLANYRKRKKQKKIIIGIIAAVCVLYLGISIFFVKHFYIGTTINGISFSGKTVQDVETYMKQQVADYVLTLKEREGKSEQIKGTDINLQYKVGDGLEKALKKQNPLLWITSLFGADDTEVNVKVEYNKESLDQLMAGLEAMKEENQIAPVYAQPVFNGEQFEIQEETYGSLIDKEQFSKKVYEFVGQFKQELDLEKEKCYVMPKFTKDSPEVTAARDSMNIYLKASVTYNVEPASEVVNKSLISQWVTVDGDMKVIFSTDAVGAYVDELCKKYNTAGKVRSITTPTGKTAQVSGGGYGWKVDRDGELTALINNITAGETVTREPVYAQKAASHGAADWGSTYLEVDLSTQHMWYIKNGAVAFESDVVTGLPTPKRETPQGVYTILEKINGKYLTGEIQPNGKPEYRTWVDYWMRVTWSGIGFHDAPWQPKFGGELYKSKGSHGCINMPVSAVSQLYGMVEKGCPVVMHY